MFNKNDVVNALEKYYRNTKCENIDIHYTSNNPELPGLHSASNFNCYNKDAIDELMAEIDMIVNLFGGNEIKLVNSETNEVIYEFAISVD